MRERIYELGGQLEVRPETQGTTVSATIPIPAAGKDNSSAAESAA
jgi:signal transduction histidine kinase